MDVWEDTGTMSQSGQLFDTFPKFLLRNATRFAGRPAMRHKDYGIWQTGKLGDLNTV